MLMIRCFSNVVRVGKFTRKSRTVSCVNLTALWIVAENSHIFSMILQSFSKMIIQLYKQKGANRKGKKANTIGTGR